MERYSGTQAMEAVQVDPVAEWAAPGGETGLEEPMWQLGLGGGSEPYPERPDEPDCIYYLRTGYCGYGNRCRFNHPRDRGTAMVIRPGAGDYPERVGQAVCQYYMRTGMCKFVASCKYHHPKHGIGPSAPVALNFYGFPLRPGEKECSYYAKTAQCKFGVTCKYHHPQPAGIQMTVPPPGTGPLTASAPLPTAAIYPTGPSPSIQSSQQYGMIQGNWPVARPTMFPGTYVPGNFGPMLLPPGVVPVPGWTPYPAPASPVASPSTQVGGPPVYGITQLSPSATAYTGPYLSITSSAGPSSSSQKEQAYPQRPGHPECQFFLRTGDCKFGATCKYHHPLELNASKNNFVLSPVGLPLRPGVPPCSHYAQNGVCRFGLSCKFDHPLRTLSYSPSASSLTDMPVAPYPVGSTYATLAPAYSSADLRHGYGFPSHLSSTSSTSAQFGSILSRNEDAPQSGLQQSGQGSSGGSGETNTSS